MQAFSMLNANCRPIRHQFSDQSMPTHAPAPIRLVNRRESYSVKIERIASSFNCSRLELCSSPVSFNASLIHALSPMERTSVHFVNAISHIVDTPMKSAWHSKVDEKKGA
jgi:hypothetical protein